MPSDGQDGDGVLLRMSTLVKEYVTVLPPSTPRDDPTSVVEVQ
jgi:hypothetical protein